MSIYFGNGSGNLQADRRYDMALEFTKDGDFAAAADLLRQGIELAPAWPPLHFHLGEALRRCNEAKEAEVAFRHYLALDPEDRMGAMIKLSIMGVIPAPDTMPEDYVRALFDQYAPRFEKSLVENLSYHTPEAIAASVLKIHASFDHLLDLGCGTGLGAQQFTERTTRMTGIDLAPGMIEIARAKNIYDDLQVSGIENFLDQTKDFYDLILAADVFVYIGDLKKIFKQISSRLVNYGLFAFSIQSLSNGSWKLGDDHRYAHSKTYIEECAKSAGLEILVCKNTTLRQDAGKPIEGIILIYRRK